MKPVEPQMDANTHGTDTASQVAILRAQLANLESDLATVRGMVELQAARRKFVVAAIILPLVAMRGLSLVAQLKSVALAEHLRQAGGALVVATWLIVVLLTGRHRSVTRDWPFYRLFRVLACLALIGIGAWLAVTIPSWPRAN